MIAQYGKRALSLFLAIIMIFSAVPVQAFAAEDEHDHEHQAEDIVVASEQTEVSAEKPAEASVEEPEEEPAEEPEEEPAEEPEEEPAEEPEEEPAEEPEEEPAEELEEEPAEEPEEEPAGEPEEEPAEEPEEEPAEEPEEEPAEESEEEPAEEPEEEPAEEPAEELTEFGESEALIALRAEIAAYIEELGITPDMPDQLLLYAYGNHESLEAAQASLTKLDEFEQKGMKLSEEEQQILMAEQNTKLCLRYRDVVAKAYETEVLANCTVNGVKFETTSDGASVSASGTTVTATISGKAGSCGGSDSARTMVLYVTNTSTETGVVSFSMTQSSINSIKGADGENISGMGSYSRTLEAGASFTITVTTGANTTQNKLTLTDIVFTPATQSFTVTVEYPTANGTVTSSVEGTSEDVDGTTTMTIPEITAADGVTLTANGSNFLCWVDKDNKLLSKDKVYTVNPSADTTVKAVLNGDVAHFLVNGNLVYGNLNDAVDMVATASNKTIVLMNNGTMPAGDYTIPSGVTLLIPYNDANTLCTTVPTTSDTSTFTAPTVYRKLTMAEGAHIAINGALSLSATQKSGGGQSSPIGACSFIQMNSGSSITVNNGGKLYAWGYIQGSGSVTVKSGGTAYECFQLMDWRGGDNTSSMIGNSKRVFPMSQYYVQNIEVPMTLEAGATENGYMSVQITLVGIQGSEVPFIGSNGMFNITSGYIIKDYDETTGRLLIDMHGDLSVKSLSLSMKLGLIGSKTINSKDYVLPINGNMTVTMHNGSDVTMTQDIALQPGARMIIEEGATCTLGSGNKIYVYDYDQWIKDSGDTYDEGKSFCGNGDAAYVNLKYPTSATTVQGRTEDAYVEVNGTADLSAGYAYTTASGASVRGTGTIILKPGTETATYQAKSLGSDSKSITYYDISITSAKLQNADGSYVETAGNKGKVIYKSVDGVWTCEHTYAEGTYQVEETAATCLAAGLRTYICNCGDHSKTEEIAQLEHEYEAVVTAPTCTEAGYTTHTCKNGCNGSYTDTPVDALGHDEQTHEAKAPTCTETGWDAYVTCSRCDYTTYVEKAALGHDYKAVVTAPTCTEAGYTTYTCSVCDDSYVADEVAALGHDYKAAVTAPTCTEAGYTTYTCSVCDDSYVGDEVAALGHDYKAVVTAPTCTEGGYTTYTCSVCDDTYTGDEVAALGHDYKAVVTAPTCTEAGYTTYTCSACGDSYVADEVAALGHAWEWVTDKEATVLETGLKHEECSVCHAKQNENTVIDILECAHTGTMTITPAKDATCTEDGNSRYSYCSACQNYYSDDAGQHEIEKDSWVIGALGHDYKAVVTAPTCTVAGYTTYTCANCGDSYVADEVEALGHDYAAVVTAPTCTEAGYTTYTCSACGDTYTGDEVTALGHDYKAVVTAPTCTEDGYTTYTCANCSDSYAADKVEALGHDEVAHEAKAPTCQSVGWDAYVTCSKCNYTTRGQDIPVDPDNHAWETEGEKTPATCQTEGKIVYECLNEGCQETKTEILPIDTENGHIWDEGVPYKNHSCNSASYMKYTCTLCDEEDLVVVREQHFRVPIAEEIPATCTEDGMTSGWKCEKCDEFWIPQEVIPALGHDWDGNYPCQSETSACTRCDLHFDTKQEHKLVTIPGVPATCTTTGLTDGAYCEYCGEVIQPQTEIPVTEHNMIVTDLEIPATCNSVGHKAGASYCLDCDYDADPIPQLTHTWMHREAKNATYTAIGWNAHDYCLLCNATRTLEQYEGDPCEFCGENPEGYIEIPKVEVQAIETFEEYLSNIGYLEMMAEQYAKEHPGTDPLGLVLNYLRTAVANYTTGSWAIMAGAEDKDFLKYVQEAEDAINSNPEIEVWVNVSGLKKIENYAIPGSTEMNPYSGKKVYAISGHFYGTMDMTYHNKGSQNHADVGGWVGDLTDLLSTTDEYGVPADLTLEEKIAYITENYLFKTNVAGSAGSFGSSDLYADLEGFYFMNELITKGYNTGDLAKLMGEYFQPSLTLKQRVAYLLNNRLDGLSTRQDLRTAVYNAYTSNKLISTLEGTRNFNATGNELAELRKAVCYAFADEMCRIAGDYVEDLTNDRFTIFDTETKILAPGISQQINYATNADGKQIVYYVATADVTREDVGLWVNYYSREPGTPENPIWKNNSVPSSAQNAQDRYGDPASEDYIENFNVIVSTNAGGYSMQEDATPGGLFVMNGVEWYPQTNTSGFFAILDDGTAYMGTHDEYKSMMAEGKIQEAIGGFGEFVVQDGKVVGSATYSDAPRTSVGITATGRVVLMCIDGRQAPFSSGASLQDVGYIMKEAGCVIAINLDGGGSTTFVARQPGSDELTVMNRPSDGYPRNVSTNLLVYSTAPSSTKFDHAVIESEYDYATICTPVQMTAAGVSPAGNAVDIPEGATWEVGNTDWASITEDGVFTGKRLGEVYVYLMLDGKEIGSKLMTLTTPDQLYFERAKVDVIYGSGVELPLRARIDGKAIAINANDVTFTLSAPKAGTMEGFTFQSVESDMKSLTITAAIGEDIKASINVMLYKQGENSFDFDKATGGDRNLAWYREVSNSKLEDSNIYNVIDPSEDMVTSYTFAMDMTTIPIPERIEELTYMLPGGTMEGATAWSFLMSLAQRISDLSWVKATIDFDDRLDVDYSELKILNEYFTMKEMTFDEETNTLTVTMNWIKQSQVIDEATANPLCLISGFKLTPKAGVWEDVSKINVVTSGTIGYEIYMRASGLYSFAQKPESQAVFGIYPYRNPADTSDAGGYFRDTYAEITDEYTLVNAVKEGWVNEEGGFAYYVDGKRLTGVQKVEGFYYDFGENGVNVGQTKLTSLFYDEEAQAYRYSYIGELADGWQSIGGDWYYFKNYKAVSGPTKVGQLNLEFEENGKLISGVWMNTLYGYRYYYGPGYYSNSWREIDGEWYYFRSGYRVTGIQFVPRQENKAISEWRLFDENGVDCGLAPDGMYNFDGVDYYLVNGQKNYGLHKVGEDYYLFKDTGIVKNKTAYAWVSRCDLPVANYEFGADGKMLNGVVEKEDGLYFYENGTLATCGMVYWEGDYYYVYWEGIIKTGKQYVVRTRCDLPAMQHYEFGADGKMLNGVVEKEDGLYFYENGVLATCGMVYWEGNYYYVYWEGVVKTGRQYVVRTRCDLPAMQNYEFGADGKMLNGVVEKADGLYFYENGAPATCGMVYWEGDYYYVYWEGVIKTGKQYVVRTRCDLPAQTHYEFAADGKMVSGIVEKDGVRYFYENGALATCGLIEWNGNHYYVYWDGVVQTGKHYVPRTRCDLPVGNYEFGADGKMLEGIVEIDGEKYFYENGVPATCGLINWEGDYYYVYWEGIIKTGKQYVVRTRCDLPVGNYEFDEEGKMIDGFIVRDGVKYYYENGIPATRGLSLIDGEYYYVYWNGEIKTGRQYTVATNCDLPIGTYEFDEEGKIFNGFYDGEDGSIYYYINGKKAAIGLYYVDGYYYFVTSGGKLITNQTKYYVYKGNGLLFETYYDFNELGQIIGESKK